MLIAKCYVTLITWNLVNPREFKRILVGRILPNLLENTIKPIAEQVVQEGKKFKAVRLDKYVVDPDHKAKDLNWTFKPNPLIQVEKWQGRWSRLNTK